MRYRQALKLNNGDKVKMGDDRVPAIVKNVRIYNKVCYIDVLCSNTLHRSLTHTEVF